MITTIQATNQRQEVKGKAYYTYGLSITDDDKQKSTWNYSKSATPPSTALFQHETFMTITYRVLHDFSADNPQTHE